MHYINTLRNILDYILPYLGEGRVFRSFFHLVQTVQIFFKKFFLNFLFCGFFCIFVVVFVMALNKALQSFKKFCVGTYATLCIWIDSRG